MAPKIAVAARAALPDLPFFWIGDPRHLPKGTAFAEISAPGEARSVPAARLPVLPHRFAGDAVAGAPDPRNAQGVIDVIARAVSLVQGGSASAICTLPIHKKGVKDGAGLVSSHTECLAHLAGDVPVVMMLASETLRVVPATIHIALSEVPAALTPTLLEEVIRLTAAGLIRDFGIARSPGWPLPG